MSELADVSYTENQCAAFDTGIFNFLPDPNCI